MEKVKNYVRPQKPQFGRDRITSSQRRKIIRIGRIAAQTDAVTADTLEQVKELVRSSQNEYLTWMSSEVCVYSAFVVTAYAAITVKIHSFELNQEYSIMGKLVNSLPAHVFANFLQGYESIANEAVS